jgi:hypothetical protein
VLASQFGEIQAVDISVEAVDRRLGDLTRGSKRQRRSNLS